MSERSLREHAEAVFAESLERLAGSESLHGLREELLSCRERLTQPMRVVVVGLTNAGKSTLLNALLGTQLVPTGPVETTYNVSWIHYGTAPALRLHFKDERPSEERPFGDYASLAQHASGDPERNNVKYVELSVPVPLLQQFDLVDTPGVASDSREDSDQTRRFIGAYGDVLTAATNEEASNADAVLFLFKSALHQTDLSVAQEIQGPAFGRATPINSIGVLTRIDAYWQSPEVPDPLAAGLRVAERNSALPQVRSCFYTIKPVCGLLGLGAQTLTPGEIETLLRLSALPEERLASLVGDETRFAERAYADVEVSPAERGELLARLGLYGVWLACGLVRAGCREPELLKVALEEHSGLVQLRELILSHFGNRAFVIKLETVLHRLRARCFGELRRTQGAEREAVAAIAAAFSRVRSDEHVFAELDVLRDFYGGKLSIDEAEVRQLLEVTGEFGASAHARLGVAEGLGLDELLLTARARVVPWQRRANDFKPVNLETVTAARTLARSYEILIDRLVKGELQPPPATGDGQPHAPG